MKENRWRNYQSPGTAAFLHVFSLAFLTLLISAVAVGQETEPPPPRGYVAHYGTPAIDGQIDEAWKQSVFSPIDRPVKQFTRVPLDQAASAKFRCLWDEQNLYVLLIVTDEQLSANNPAPWEQDSVEVFIDETFERAESYQDDDGQYRVNFNGKATYGPSTPHEMRFQTTETEAGYLVEVAIAWKKIKPYKNLRIGFDAQLNDDPGTGKRQAVLKWNDITDNTWKDTSGFGTVTLVGGPEANAEMIAENERAKGNRTIAADERVPSWAQDAVFYQIFPERFRNGDPSNDPDHASLEFPEITPNSWRITPWTDQWYKRADWERQMGDNFYEDGVFHRRFGGDLQGVIDKLDYLSDLGINTIYFNPVFYARSLHKYDGNSFHHIDPHFGPDPEGDFRLMSTETADPKTWQWTAADKLFLELIEAAHRKNIRIIIDGVFNHTGRDFWAFADIAKRQQESPYLDWYTVHQFDNPETPQNEFKYACWWGVDTLPEFADNEDGTDLHPKPKAYVFQSTMRWMDPNGDGDPSDGIDGWRLDVANEVPKQFWRDWNSAIRELNPEAFTVAEYWDDAGDYLADCGFSSTMNYFGFAYPVKGFLVDGRLPASQFAQQVSERLSTHPKAVQFALQNLIDSHDVDRVASQIVNADQQRDYVNESKHDYDVGERVSPRHFPAYDISRPTDRHQRILRLVATFQMTFVGAPMIYYGTETGMDGADDPDDRMPMVWEDLRYEPRTLGPYGPLERSQPIAFDRELFKFYQSVIALRNQHPALRRGSFRVISTNDAEQTLVFQRDTDEQRIVVVFNRGEKESTVQLESSAKLIFSSQPNSLKATEGDPTIYRVRPLSAHVFEVNLIEVKGS